MGKIGKSVLRKISVFRNLNSGLLTALDQKMAFSEKNDQKKMLELVSILLTNNMKNHTMQ